MADDRKAALKHRVIVEQRENVTVTGVVDVISFDEECIVADTSSGVIVLKGINLHVNNLNLDNGELGIDGEIDSITYEESGGFGKNKSSFLSKIFK